jgi:hypothetical protein
MAGWSLSRSNRHAVLAVDRRPNLFVVGAPKAATTSLYAFLAAHPDVFMSQNKEPHYFSTLSISRREARFLTVVRDLHEYEALFANAGTASLRGEASTSYLADPDAPGRISTYSPRSFVIAVLREPVDRAYSHYLYNFREGTERRSFLEAIESARQDPASERWPANYVSAGLYAAGIERYRRLFAGKVLVVFFEDLKRDPAGTGERVCRFLGLCTDGVAGRRIPRENAYGRPRAGPSGLLLRSIEMRLAARMVVPRRLRPAFRRLLIAPGKREPLDPRLVELLADLYEPDVRRLEQSLGSRPPWSGEAV